MGDLTPPHPTPQPPPVLQAGEAGASPGSLGAQAGQGAGTVSFLAG